METSINEFRNNLVNISKLSLSTLLRIEFLANEIMHALKAFSGAKCFRKFTRQKQNMRAFKDEPTAREMKATRTRVGPTRARRAVLRRTRVV